jgi:hypothetical protein
LRLSSHERKIPREYAAAEEKLASALGCAAAGEHFSRVVGRAAAEKYVSSPAVEERRFSAASNARD